MTTRPALWLFGPALVWLGVAAVGLVRTASDPEAWGAVDRRAAAVVGSEACGVCHPAQVASWRQTFHRTMTQPAAGAAVLAPFAGESLVYQGFRATMTRTGFGRPHLRVEAVEGGAPLLDVDVALTVGSHRYQQYVARLDRGGGPGEMWRLPVAWHLGERRWIAMNAAFLEPEGEPGDAEDYLRHFGRWNDNCILCHNTQPVPGLVDMSQGTGEAMGFASRVGEFGIACEACHGPAGGHVERQADPATGTFVFHATGHLFNAIPCLGPDGKPTPSLAEELAHLDFRNILPWTRGVDTELFRPRPDRLFGSDPVALYVGRVAVEKNLAAFLSLDLPGSKVVIGDGPDLEKLRRAGLTILLVEQDVHAALDFADRAYVLEGGAIALQGSADALRENSHVRELYLGL